VERPLLINKRKKEHIERVEKNQKPSGRKIHKTEILRRVVNLLQPRDFSKKSHTRDSILGEVIREEKHRLSSFEGKKGSSVGPNLFEKLKGMGKSFTN